MEPASPLPPSTAPPRGAVFLGSLGGAPVHFHLGVLLALPLFAWMAEARLRAPVALASVHGRALAPSWAWSIALAVVLLLAIVGHAAAHALASRRLGLPRQSIDIDVLGRCRGHGFAPAGTMPAGPHPARWAEALAAGSGPLLTLALGAALFLVGRRAPGPLDVSEALELGGGALLALGGLQLLPAPALDGGRLLSLGLERRFGAPAALRATVILGRAAGIALAAAGTVMASALLIGVAAVLWASTERAAEGPDEPLAHRLTVAAVLGAAPPPPAWIDGEATALAAAARMRAERRLHLLVYAGDELVGLLFAHDLVRLAPARRPTTAVHAVARPTPTIPRDASARGALALMRSRGLDALPVVHEGAVLGVITLNDLVAAESYARLEPPSG